MLALLIIFVAPSRDVDSVERELTARLDHIDGHLAALQSLRCRLALLHPSQSGSIGHATERILTEKTLTLISVNTARTKALRNAKIWTTPSSPLPGDYPTWFRADDIAPIFTFIATGVSIAEKVIFDPVVPAECAVRMVRFTFHHGAHRPFVSRVVDLPHGITAQIDFDLEVAVPFTKVDVDVLVNWGDPHRTCLNPFHVLGAIPMENQTLAGW
jgi:hypothetical protein